MCFKIPSAKWWPFCLGGNVLAHLPWTNGHQFGSIHFRMHFLEWKWDDAKAWVNKYTPSFWISAITCLCHELNFCLVNQSLCIKEILVRLRYQIHLMFNDESNLPCIACLMFQEPGVCSPVKREWHETSIHRTRFIFQIINPTSVSLGSDKQSTIYFIEKLQLYSHVNATNKDQPHLVMDVVHPT